MNEHIEAVRRGVERTRITLDELHSLEEKDGGDFVLEDNWRDAIAQRSDEMGPVLAALAKIEAEHEQQMKRQREARESMRGYARELEAELEPLRARVEQLEGALQPIDACWQARVMNGNSIITVGVSFEMVRTASEAYRAAPEPKDQAQPPLPTWAEDTNKSK